MSATKKILTLHPQKKNGVNISLEKYTILKNFITDYLNKYGTSTYQDLNNHGIAELSDSFDGSVAWYLVTVKLDLEARKIIKRIPKTSPHQVALSQHIN